MIFPHPHEDATYRLLKQVLQNHLNTSLLSLETALAACESLLAMMGAGFGVRAPDDHALVASAVAFLKQAVRARQFAPPLLPLLHTAAPLRGEPSTVTPSMQLAAGLGRLLADAWVEHGLTGATSFRIVLHLTADLCAMRLHQWGNTLAEVELLIEQLGTLLARDIPHYRQVPAQDELPPQDERAPRRPGSALVQWFRRKRPAGLQPPQGPAPTASTYESGPPARQRPRSFPWPAWR